MKSDLPASLADPRATLRRAAWLAGLLLAALAAGAGLRAHAAARQARELAQTTSQQAVRSVRTDTPRTGPGRRTLSLPGTLRGHTEAALHARTSGYVASWTKDIGDRVRQGELLAVIDAPEADHELLQASAARDQVQARLGLARSSLARWEGLGDIVSQQALDERRALLRQGEADLAAAEANLQRLNQLKAFRRIVAPFDGVVVRRNVEIGGLVAAGNNGAGRELFQLAQTDPLRVTVAVPQVHAGGVHVGQEATVQLTERPGALLKGRVARTAGAVDTDSRAMAVEIELPNPEGRLLPGAYVEVGLSLQGEDAARLTVPAGAVQFRQEGPRLATVDARQRVLWRSVKLGRDLGKTVEILSGLSAADRIVLNPPDTLEEGETVVATSAPAPAP